MGKKEELKSINGVIVSFSASEEGKSILKDNNDISKAFKKLISFSNEHDSKSFLMMVIGPTKSGKSTLVNLLARKIVSPTDMAECTIRPSIIAKHNKDGVYDESKSIIVYKSKVDKEEEKVNCLDGILSNLKGTVTDDELEKMLTIEEHDFKDLKNIITPQKYVYDNTVITEIRTNPDKKDGDFLSDKADEETTQSTEDGDILSDKAGEETTQSTEDGGILSDYADGNSIFIVDMPGFDGAIVNQPTQDGTDKEDYLYRAITDRVDLIIFVQSSVGAVLDSTTRYFDYVKSCINKAVPVYLIHNEYDSTYWRTTSENDIQNQRDAIFKAIKKEGINIDKDHVKSANLGQAYDHLFNRDHVKEGYDLSDAFTKFVTIEKELRKEIIDQAEDSRLENCKNRIKEAQKRLLDVLDTAITDLEIKETERTNKKSEITTKISNQKIIVLRDRNFNESKDNQNKKRDDNNIEEVITGKIKDSFEQHKAGLNQLSSSKDAIKKCFEAAVQASENNIKEWFKTQVEIECDQIKNDGILKEVYFRGLDKKTIDEKYETIVKETMINNSFDGDKGLIEYTENAIPKTGILDKLKTKLGNADIVTIRTDNFRKLSETLIKPLFSIVQKLATETEKEIQKELKKCCESYFETLYSEEDAKRKALLETFKEKIKGLRF